MTQVRAPLLRIPMTLVLVGLIGFSILDMKNIEATSAQAWQKNMREQELYQKAPNCFPHRDASQVDQSLPPCQNVMATVVSKPQKAGGNPLRYHAQPITHLFLTLQFSDGSIQTVGTIYKDMWHSIRVGDQVSVTLWSRQVEEVEANGYRSPIIDTTGWDRGFVRLLPWLAVVLLCLFFISRLWNFGRRQTDYV